MSSYKEKRAKYFEEVLRLHYQEGLSPKKIAKILPLAHSTIELWITNFAVENNISKFSSYEVIKSKLPKPSEEEKMTDDEIKALKAENLILRRQVRDAEMRADLYNEIINVAEKQFNIPIRKKAGAKQ